MEHPSWVERLDDRRGTHGAWLQRGFAYAWCRDDSTPRANTSQRPTAASRGDSARWRPVSRAFAIFASIAEFERELIRDRVGSAIASAKAKGKRLGRPRANVEASRVAALRAQGRSWAFISPETGISKGTAQRAVLSLPKNPIETAPPSA